MSRRTHSAAVYVINDRFDISLLEDQGVLSRVEGLGLIRHLGLIPEGFIYVDSDSKQSGSRTRGRIVRLEDFLESDEIREEGMNV